MVNDASVIKNVNQWLIIIEIILNECGLSYVWTNQAYNGPRVSLLSLIDYRLQDQFFQTWWAKVNESNKCIHYRIFKTELKLENFYIELSDYSLQTIINLRLRNNHLPVEKGSWLGVHHNDRKCSLCNLNEIGDEFHYLFCCTFFNTQRSLHIPFVKTHRPNTLLFKIVMCENDPKKLNKLSKFFRLVLETVKDPPG